MKEEIRMKHFRKNVELFRESMTAMLGLGDLVTFQMAVIAIPVLNRYRGRHFGDTSPRERSIRILRDEIRLIGLCESYEDALLELVG